MQAPRWSGNSVRARGARKRPLALAALLSIALLLGAFPIACLSDVTVPSCVLNNDCGDAGQATDAGAGGELGGNGGSAPQAPTAGRAGEPPESGGNGGDDPLDEGGAAGLHTAGAGGEGGCGACVIKPLHIPDPCGSDPYFTDISVSGGTANYEWQVSGTTGVWQIQPKPNSTDGSQATLTGTASGAAQVKVTLTDGAGLTKEWLYSVLPRSSCYFAYVAPDVNGPKLGLRDPQLGIDASANVANNQGVYDFQFSPDGRFLSYRYGEDPTHPNGAHVSLLDLSTMQDQALAATGETIDAYAWSPDSKVLAIAFTDGGTSQLGGIKLTSGAGPTQITALTPVTAANPVESNLLWVDTGFVSFFSTATLDMGAPPSGFSVTLYSSLGATGFDAPVPITDIFYQPDFVAVSAPGGLFVTSPNDDRSVYNSISIDNGRDEDHQTNFVDPAGRFSASIANKALTLFKASNSSVPFENTASSADFNCPKLLTWAPGKERFACVAHETQASTTWGEIRIFDAGSATPFVLVPTPLIGFCVKDSQGVPLGGGQCSQSEYDYDETSSVGQPRLLSNSGRWLAFVTGAQSGGNGFLHWADVSAPSPSLNRKSFATATSTGQPVALAFSPSERFLLHQNGNQLVAHLLAAGEHDGGDLELDVNLNAPAAPPCAEDFATGAPRWCGGAVGSPTFTWSPDANTDVLAYRKGNTLIVVDLAAQGFNALPPFAAPVCDATCSGQYAFQPPRL